MKACAPAYDLALAQFRAIFARHSFESAQIASETWLAAFFAALTEKIGADAARAVLREMQIDLGWR